MLMWPYIRLARDGVSAESIEPIWPRDLDPKPDRLVGSKHWDGAGGPDGSFNFDGSCRSVLPHKTQHVCA